MAGLVSPSTLEQIRAASDIVEIIGGYVPLKRAGANFVALCPFHREKSPSFHVNPHRQIFHCFGCHKGGDVFSFIKDYENVGFMDAVRRLAERARIPLEFEKDPGYQQNRALKDTLLQVHEQITQRWHNALLNDAAGQIARDYLEKRGVSAEAIQLFRLGFAPDAWDDTVNWAKSKGHDLALMEKAGLIIHKEDSQRFYDRFRGRLIFPICDDQGRVIGFSGRILSGDEKTAKYVNSPETPLFTKSKVIYGLDKSKRALLDAQQAIICEGQLDLIACYMAGVKNVVAPQGTALTAEHARILKRYAEEVVLCFDADNAGQNAAVRSLDSLLEAGLSVRVATIPAPHDPDSFIKEHGGDAFAKHIQNAESFFDFYLNRLCVTHDAGSDRGRVAIVEAMRTALQKTGNVVLLDAYAQKTALRLGVSPESVRAEFKKARGLRPVPAPMDEPDSLPPESDFAEESETPPSPQEFWLLKLLFLSDDHIEWVAHHLDLDWINHPTVRQVVASRLQAHAEESWAGLAGWVSELESPVAVRLITEAATEDRAIPDSEVILKGAPGKQGVVELLRDKFIDRQLAAVHQQLAQPGLDDIQAIELSRQKLHLRQLKKQPLIPLADHY